MTKRLSAVLLVFLLTILCRAQATTYSWDKVIYRVPKGGLRAMMSLLWVGEIFAVLLAGTRYINQPDSSCKVVPTSIIPAAMQDRARGA